MSLSRRVECVIVTGSGLSHCSEEWRVSLSRRVECVIVTVSELSHCNEEWRVL